MNNNNNQKGKESDIITKKGFLISLPGKKNGASQTESSIHLSGEAVQGKQDNAKDGKNNKKNRHDRNRNNGSNGGNVTDTKQTENEKQRQDKHAKNRDGVVKNAPSEENRNKNSAVLAEKSSAKDNRDAKGGKNDRSERNERNDRNDRNDRKGKHGKNHNRDRRGFDGQNEVNEKNEKQQSNERRDNTGTEQERHDRRDNRNDRNRRHNEKNDKKVKTAPLSALSAEISEYTQKAQPKVQTVVEKEQSLEEKYKNAKPLAQQIAEQEMRAKGIKVPDDEPKEVENVEIVGIRFREAGKIYYFDPDGRAIPFGTPVIVETARGNEYGYTAISNRLVPCNSLTSPLKKIQRIATEIDTQKHVANRDLEKQAEEVFREKVAKLGLEMNLIYVEYTFDNSRLLFYFTAETRIDFRELVKELAGVFRTRIELRQIGVRDEAKAIGGIGVCGRANCCNTFLGDFAQVSIKMAKDQSLSLNAAKISGACGKLMCCLRYEDKVYEEENARTPKVGSIVETPEGKGHVVERNVLKGIVKVSLDHAPDAVAQPYSRDDIKVIGFNKSKSDEDDADENLDELKDVEG